MDTDHAVDDKFKPRQTHAGIGIRLKIESAVGIADIHHNAKRQLGQLFNIVGIDVETQQSLVDVTGITLGTGYGDLRPMGDFFGGIATANHRRYAHFPGDDSGMTGTAAPVGNDGGGPLHDGFPVRIGHIGDQHIAIIDQVHFTDTVDNLDHTLADAVTDTAALCQHPAFFLEQIALHARADITALHGFRSRLHNIDETIVTVPGPLDIHGATVVLLNNQSLSRQVHNLVISDAKAHAIPLRHIDCLHRLADAGALAVDHFNRLATEVAAQYCGPALL